MLSPGTLHLVATIINPLLKMLNGNTQSGSGRKQFVHLNERREKLKISKSEFGKLFSSFFAIKKFFNGYEYFSVSFSRIINDFIRWLIINALVYEN